ncbi:transcription factor of the MADS box [Massospora cicadina]|nr:transcription factor of the MADS box [Massospora cicadina]
MSHNQGCQLGPYGDPSMDYGNYQNFGGNGGDDKDGRRAGRRKIKIEYIQDKSRRHITFSKRKAGIMKKAYELSTLTGTQVLLLVVSETGLVYTFTTPKLQPLVTKTEGKNLIQSCLNTPDELQKEGSAAPEAEPEEGGFSSGDTAAPTLPNGNREPEPIKRLLDHAQDEMHKHEAKKFSPDQPQLSYGATTSRLILGPTPHRTKDLCLQPLNTSTTPKILIWVHLTIRSHPTRSRTSNWHTIISHPITPRRFLSNSYLSSSTILDPPPQSILIFTTPCLNTGIMVPHRLPSSTPTIRVAFILTLALLPPNSSSVTDLS